MFSKELENLIQATLEDGVLEEYEKTALVKRAQAEGVDLTELEIYINSILQKRQRELKKKKSELDEKYRKEKKEAFGRVCPNCGKQVPPMTLKCDCGYEFTNQKKVTSSSLLAEKIEKILHEEGEGRRKDDKDKNNLIIETINFHPVPNSKEDILEFLAMGVAGAKDKPGWFSSTKGQVTIGILLTIILLPIYGLGLLVGLLWFDDLSEKVGVMKDKRAKAWRAKCEQVLLKGRSLRGDADFTQQLDYYENLLKKK